MKNFINIINLILLLFFTACSVNYDSYYKNLENYFKENNYKELVNCIDKNKKSIYSKKSLILYYLDKAFFMHISQNYLESNKYFSLAEKLHDEYYTKSITKGTLSLFVNDKFLVYSGEDFEFSMVFIFKALNYIMMDDLENALVEVRRGITFHKNLSNILTSKDAFKKNAFFDYISGILFEMNGDYNEAFISYKNALNLYNTSYFNYNFTQDLFNSTLDMAKKSNLDEKIEILKKEYPKFYQNYKKANTSEVIILSYMGKVPYKISNNLEMSIFDARQNFFIGFSHYKAQTDEDNKVKDVLKTLNSLASDYTISFSFPEYKKFFYKINAGKILFNDKKYELEKVLDIGDIVLKNFEYKKFDIYFKEISRAVLKTSIVNNITKKVEEKNENSVLSSIFGTGLKILSNITEDADKRSWRVLPDKIFMARVPIVHGENFSLNFEYYQDKFKLMDFSLDLKNNLNEKYNKKFVILRTIE